MEFSRKECSLQAPLLSGCVKSLGSASVPLCHRRRLAEFFVEWNSIPCPDKKTRAGRTAKLMIAIP
jgi:hypothetical protein